MIASFERNRLASPAVSRTQPRGNAASDFACRWQRIQSSIRRRHRAPDALARAAERRGGHAKIRSPTQAFRSPPYNQIIRNSHRRRPPARQWKTPI